MMKKLLKKLGKKGDGGCLKYTETEQSKYIKVDNYRRVQHYIIYILTFMSYGCFSDQYGSYIYRVAF